MRAPRVQNIPHRLSTIVPPFTLIGAWHVAGARSVSTGGRRRDGRLRLGDDRLTGNLPQWSAVGLGYYAVFPGLVLFAARDPATSPGCLGDARVSLHQHRLRARFARRICIGILGGAYAETVVLLPSKNSPLCREQTARLQGSSASSPGRVADACETAILRADRGDRVRRRSPIVPIWIGYTPVTRCILRNELLSQMFGLLRGAAAATTQDLVLPRMRGTATAAFSWRQRLSAFRSAVHGFRSRIWPGRSSMGETSG